MVTLGPNVHFNEIGHLGIFFRKTVCLHLLLIFLLFFPVIFTLLCRQFFIYCLIYILLIFCLLSSFSICVFSDIPWVNPCESIGIVYSTLHKDILFFVSYVEVGATLIKSSVKEPLGYWLWRVRQGLEVLGILECWHLWDHIKIKMLISKYLLCAI